MKTHRFPELREAELCRVRGGDLCIIGYRLVDLDGDGAPDLLEPIYADCGKTPGKPPLPQA